MIENLSAAELIGRLKIGGGTMDAVRATWRNGRIEIDHAVDWPEGCRLLIQPDKSNGAAGAREPDQSNTPEAIAEWLVWYDSLEPIVFTPAEEASFAARRQKPYFGASNAEAKHKA
jgi:hypothetical protein